MTSAEPISLGVPPEVALLAEVAVDGKLVVCIGAGVSFAEPTALPLGANLAARVHDAILELIGPTRMPECDRDNLLSVADAVAVDPPGLKLVQSASARAAEFTEAPPNLGHEAIAALIAEGSIAAFSWNWDDCIERAGASNNVSVVISDQDRIEVNRGALLKAHGCATKPSTLLVSSEQLRKPPAWVTAEIDARIRDCHVVFVGIGDVADYTRESIDSVLKAIDDLGHVFVVSPSIRQKWNESQWSDTTPDLNESNKIERTSDKFFGELANGVVLEAMSGLRSMCDGDAVLTESCGVVREAIATFDGIAILKWLRRSTYRAQSGTRVIATEPANHSLLAIGKVLRGQEVRFDGSAFLTEDTRFELLIALKGQTAGALRREATSRMREITGRGHVGGVTFICFGALTPLEPEPVSGDIVSDADAADIVSGAFDVAPTLRSASSILEEVGNG